MLLWGVDFHMLCQVCLNSRLEITMLPEVTCGFRTQWHQIQMSTVWLPSYSEGGSEGPYIFSSQCESSTKVSSVFIKLLSRIFLRHIEVRFKFPQCDYKATEKSNLKTHIDSVHNGVIYKCPLCDYQATRKGALKVHINSVHNAIKYKCLQCDYQATRKGATKSHIYSVHNSNQVQMSAACFSSYSVGYS